MRFAGLLASEDDPASTYLWPRWLFLRGLGLIFLSVFYSLAFQIHGLIGERGILPANEYLVNVRAALGFFRGLWYAPTLLWLNAGDWALAIVVAGGIISSLLLTANLWPRLTTILCTVLFLSCIGVLQDFSMYQSDGMLLGAGFLSSLVPPRRGRPLLGGGGPPVPLLPFLVGW